MPGKKRNLKKIKKITLDKAKPSVKTGKGMMKSGRIKGKMMGGTMVKKPVMAAKGKMNAGLRAFLEKKKKKAEKKK
jgi:hypothetical protein|tara:strand:+ start:65 stop:292 length:228 start_codon:yes stop_codon:yes gene_type:complete